MNLARHTKVNREFFEPGAGPRREEWCAWIRRGVVKGKIIDGKPYIDINWFAASPPELEPQRESGGTTVMDLLAS